MDPILKLHKSIRSGACYYSPSPPPPTSDPLIATLFHIIDAFLSKRAPPSLPLRLTSIHYEAFLSIRNYIHNTLAFFSTSFAKTARLNYDGRRNTLFISRPGLSHDLVSNFVRESLTTLTSNNRAFFGTVWANDPTRTIDSSLSAVELTLNGKKMIREPDCALRLSGNVFPFLVCEVADTQPIKPLFRKAYEYIAGSKGAIRFVIFVKLERAPPENTLTLESNDIDHILEATESSPGGSHIPEAKSPITSLTQISRGVFSVYTYALPTSVPPQSVAVICIEDEQEFYPTPATSTLQLTWPQILRAGTVPEHVADKVVDIPYSQLGDVLVGLLREKIEDFDSGADLDCWSCSEEEG